jgi:hypothetical protein
MKRSDSGIDFLPGKITCFEDNLFYRFKKAMISPKRPKKVIEC